MWTMVTCVFSSEAGNSQLQGVQGMRSWSVPIISALTSTNLTLLEVWGMSGDKRPGMPTDSQK